MTSTTPLGPDTRCIVILLSGESVAIRVQNGCDTDYEQFSKGNRGEVGWLAEDARTLAI